MCTFIRLDSASKTSQTISDCQCACFGCFQEEDAAVCTSAHASERLYIILTELTEERSATNMRAKMLSAAAAAAVRYQWSDGDAPVSVSDTLQVCPCCASQLPACLAASLARCRIWTRA